MILEKIKKNSILYKSLLFIKAKIENFYYKFFLYIFHLFPISNNKILITNFFTKGFGDNAKYIVLELLKLDKDFDIVWVTKDVQSLPKKIRNVKPYSIKWIYELATSKVWINNCRFPHYIVKRRNQYYIQTWHGGLGLKKIEKDAENKLSPLYIKSAKNDSYMMNYAISNSRYRTNLYKNSFWYGGKILEYGCPRNDLFFSSKAKKEIQSRIFKRYHIDKNKRIILYAPTYRDDRSFNYLTFDFNKLLSQLRKKNNTEYVFMIRLHANAKNNLYNLPSNVIDVSDYPDVDELLLITNIVISDYSSVFFDFLYTNNPVYLYAPDYNTYMADRGLNFVYENLPFCISYNSEELIRNIANDKYLDYQLQLEKFLKQMGIVDDGHASERVAKLIVQIMKEGKIDETI